MSVILRPQSVLGGPFGHRSYVQAFKSADAVLHERSDMGCVRLTAAFDAREVAAQSEATIGIQLPLQAGSVVASDEIIALWLSPREWLIQCAIESESALVRSLNAVFPDKRAHAVPYTDALCWLELSGEGAHEVLTDGGFISLERDGLPVGHAKRTLLAQIPVLVLHKTAMQWLLGTERSRGRYFVQWLCSSAEARHTARRNDAYPIHG